MPNINTNYNYRHKKDYQILITYHFKKKKQHCGDATIGVDFIVSSNFKGVRSLYLTLYTPHFI